MTNRRTTTGTESGTSNQSTANTSTGNYAGDTENTFDWQLMPDTEDIKGLRNFQEQLDPSIGFNYAKRRTDLKNSFKNPLGGFTTPGIRAATERSLAGGLEQEYGQAQRNAYGDMQSRTAARKANLAALTRPTLTQTGEKNTGSQSTTSSGTSSGTSTGNSVNIQSSNALMDLLPSLFGGVGTAIS